LTKGRFSWKTTNVDQTNEKEIEARWKRWGGEETKSRDRGFLGGVLGTRR